MDKRMYTKRMYTIGELSKICNFSKSALRYFDSKGLLTSFERGDNNYRLYSEDQIMTALIIREMKRRGFSINTIKKMLNKFDQHTIHMAIQELEERIQELERSLAETQEKLEYIRMAKEILSKTNKCYEEYIGDARREMVIDVVPEMTILFDRRKSFFNANYIIWDRCNDIWHLREKERVTAIGPLSGIFYDHYLNQFFFDEGDLEMFIPIKETDRTGPHIRKFGGFRRASMVFVGKQIDLLATYVELVKQIERSHHKITGPAYEEYLTEFSYSIPEEHCLTRVSFPIEQDENTNLAKNNI